MRWENLPDWRWFHWKWGHLKRWHLKWWQDKSQFWRLPRWITTTPLESNIRHPPRRHRDWKQVFQKHPIQPVHLTCKYSHQRTQAATQPLDHLLGGRLRWALRRSQWHPTTKSTSCQNEWKIVQSSLTKGCQHGHSKNVPPQRWVGDNSCDPPVSMWLRSWPGTEGEMEQECQTVLGKHVDWLDNYTIIQGGDFLIIQQIISTKKLIQAHESKSADWWRTKYMWTI